MSVSTRLNRVRRALFGRARKATIVALVAVTLTTELVESVPASAGTLSSPTWTVMDPRTNVQGNRYDYSFNTATTGTVNSVAAAVPVGTSGSNRYLALNSSNSGFAYTADSPANSITGDIDLREKLSLPNWTVSGSNVLISKFNNGGSQASYAFRLVSGSLWIALSTNGSNESDYVSSAVVPFTANAIGWVRATVKANDGSGNSIATFYTSTDGTNWTQLGTPYVRNTTVAIYDGTASLGVGYEPAGFGLDIGKFYYADVRSGLSGTTVSASTCATAGVTNCFNPSDDNYAGISWKATDQTNETWTIQRSGTNYPADIASDLSIMNVSGLPAGGTAQVRELDTEVVYTLPTPTSINSGTAIKLGLAGMTNTYTAGSYTSVIKTFDSSMTAIDTSAATSPVVFTVPTINSYSATPTLYTTPTAGTSANVMASGLGVRGTNVLYTDLYSSSLNAVSTSTNQVSWLAGNGSQASIDGAAAVSGFNTPGGVVQDSAGNTYMSDNNGNRIRKLSSGGTVSTFVSSTISHIVGMTIDSSDNIYAADDVNHVVYKITTGGTVSVVAGTSGTSGSTLGANAASSYLNAPRDVAVNSAGTLLYIADTGNNRILQVTIGTGAISVFAGGGASYADGGSPTATNLYAPQGVAVDASGNVYISDTANNKIRKVSSGIITLLAGTGAGGFGGDGSAATTAVLNTPLQLRVDSSGNVFIDDWINLRIREISGSTITTFAGTGQASWTGDGGQVSNAHFWGVQQMHADDAGNVYVADTRNNSIRKINQFGVVSTVAGTGPLTPGYTGDGGSATSAKLYIPQDAIPDNNGNLYIADTGNNRLRVVNSAGNISTLANIGVSGVYQLAFSPDYSTLYVSTNAAVYAVNRTTGSFALFAGTGTSATASGDFGPATSAGMYYPRGLAVDAIGNVYISDYQNNTVRKVDPAGIITTVASTTGTSADGVSNANRVLTGAENRLAIDSTGNVEVQNGTSVYRLGANGLAANYAGQINTSGTTGNGGAATNAKFYDVEGITFSLGNLYIADAGTQSIRVINQQAAVKPLVNADSMSVAMNTKATWPILSNDWSRSNEMDPSSVTITTSPAHGTVTLTVPTTEASTLQANYTPTTSYTGSDSFTYQACDTTHVQCASATVSVTVSGNQVTTVVGGPAEGYANQIGYTPTREVKYKNYIFYSDSGANIVRRYDIYSGQTVVVAGTLSNLYTGDGGPATAAAISSPQQLALSPTGDLYIAARLNFAIRIVAANGTISSIAQNAPYGVALTQSGTLLSTNGVQVQQWNGSAWTIFAGSTSGSSGDNGLATSAQFGAINNIYTAPTGDVYVSDNTACTVRRVSGGYVYAVAGVAGTCSYTGDSGAPTAATLNHPYGVAMLSNGNLVIADNSNNVLRIISGGIITSFTTSVTAPIDVAAGNTTDYYWLNVGNAFGDYMNTSGTGTHVLGNDYVSWTDNRTAPTYQYAAWTQGPMAADPSGNIYFETGRDNIGVYTASTGLVTNLAGNLAQGYSASQIGLDPGQMVLNSSNQPIFVDTSNYVVRRINGVNNMTLLAGTPGTQSSTGDGGQATSATLNKPESIALASDGTMYVGELGRIRKVTPAGIISTIAGTGVQGYSGDGGFATSAQINEPSSLALDSSGNLYIADRSSPSVRMVDTKGYISTVLGTGTQGNGADGTAGNATAIGKPSSIVVDAQNQLYVNDISYGKVRKIDTTGTVSTIIGTTAYSFVDNTTLAAARFDTPAALFIQPSTGNLYVNDVNNRRIRLITGATATGVNTLSSAALSVVPSNTGHVGSRERLVFTPSTTTTSSKISMTVNSGWAGSSFIIRAYGITGAVPASLSGTTLTFTFPAQTLAAGVPIGFMLQGITNSGNNGVFNSNVNLYDSAGSTVTGSATTNAANLTAGGLPIPGAAGFGTFWPKSETISLNAAPTIAVNPSGTADSTSAWTLTHGGGLNYNQLALGATSLTGNGKTIAAATADGTTSVASASFASNTWGVQIAGSSSTNAGATGTGLYSGLASTPAGVLTSVGAANVTTVTTRNKVNYLTPAGTYASTLIWVLTPGV